jgi:hypothetical protein
MALSTLPLTVSCSQPAMQSGRGCRQATPICAPRETRNSQCSSSLHRPGAVESSCESNLWRPTQKGYSSRILLRRTALVTFGGERQAEPDPL